MQRAAARARPLAIPREGEPSLEVTLLEVVRALAEETADDREVVAAVLHLLRSGKIRLIGNFRAHRF